ncbi:MAG: spermine/spermidine synthase domain-containing protein [Gammaproteobacteria bacterium]
MYKYDGLVIHQSHDDDGIIEIIERNGIRSLHFGTSSRQSSMLVDDSDKLVLDYIRAMSCWLLFKETPDDALIIGLGGGSLAKFLLHQFPECRLCVVEYRKSVVKIARSHFGLPFDTRLKIIIGDGGSYIRRQTETLREKYGILFIDAFGDDGMSPSISNIAFFDACKTLLKPDGILIINLWDTDKAFYAACREWLNRAFNSKIFFLPVSGKGNIIGFAFNDGAPLYRLSELRTRAGLLEQRYQIEFTKFLKDICRRNAATLNFVMKK